jgi:plastocyanin
MQRARVAAIVFAVGLVLPAGLRGGIGLEEGNRATTPGPTALLGPDAFPCQAATGEEGYWRYGPGRMRRGGLEPEELEPDHIVIHGAGANDHGRARVTDGGTIEMEMDDDYFAPTILRGPAGATVTIELENEGTRPHNFRVPGQGIDLDCGVRARGAVEVIFPPSGVLMFICRYTATSGMRGAFAVEE